MLIIQIFEGEMNDVMLIPEQKKNRTWLITQMNNESCII